jgi:hypothetical protein
MSDSDRDRGSDTILLFLVFFPKILALNELFFNVLLLVPVVELEEFV